MDPISWDRLVSSLPSPQLLQTWEWGQVKIANGWKPQTLSWGKEAAALLLKRDIPLRGFSARLGIAYVPRGPLMDWSNEKLRSQVLDDLRENAQISGAIFLKMDPLIPLGYGIPGEESGREDALGQEVATHLFRKGWQISTEQVQFRNTVIIDLRLPEDELLQRMKQKTRYNIRLAEKKGVRVRVGSQADLGLLYKMYADTSVRDGFTIRGESYYRRAWGTFLPPQYNSLPDPSVPVAEPLIAEVDGEPVAAVVVYRFGGTAWYLNGMSVPAHREKMPNYLLQWEAMRRSKAAGCTQYDLWGAPDRFDPSDSLWGVYRFKEGLGGKVVRSLGAVDLPLRPAAFRLYTQILPKVLSLLRKRGDQKTRQVAEGA